VKHLLDEGMDVNVPAWGPKSKGLTALHLAAQGGHLEIMDELLARGANIDARTLGACGCKYLQLMEESFQAPNSLSALLCFSSQFIFCNCGS
jgi:ankyrin repeat protein